MTDHGLPSFVESTEDQFGDVTSCLQAQNDAARLSQSFKSLSLRPPGNISPSNGDEEIAYEQPGE